MSIKQTLLKKIETKSSVVSIIGLGYVGLPLALRFNNSGYKVIGLDTDSKKVELLNNGKSYIKHISSRSIKKSINNNFEATTNFKAIKNSDAIILCLPTPLNKYREPDLSYIITTLNKIKPYLREGQIISLESTTYPGTTEEEILPRVSETELKIGEEIFITYSPEREDPGNSKFNTQTIPKIIAGLTNECLEIGMALYEAAVDTLVPVSSPKVAEMTKLLENIHRAVNIGLVNEMKIVADKMNIDIFEVIDAASTKPFGFTPYYPGPGLGGHCIPIDPFYLTWKAREYGLNTKFIELSGEVNQSMPDYVLDKIKLGLNKQNKSINGSKILILGITYKKNVDDMRGSPAVLIMEKLRNLGAVLDYYDPYFDNFPKMRDHSFALKSIVLSKENLHGFDAVVLTTDHDKVDYDFIEKNAQLIIDSRGKFRKKNKKIIKA